MLHSFRKSKLLVVVSSLFLSATRAHSQCPVADVVDPATIAWSNKVIGAIVGGDACYVDRSAFANSDCNIFVGRVLEKAYNVSDFVLAAPRGSIRYQTSNEIVLALWTTLSAKWDLLGGLTEQSALDEAQHRASIGRAVVAVWRNPDSSRPGHIALIGEGPLTPSNALHVKTPVSASFFQGRPGSNYIGKPLACAFNSTQASDVRIYGRKS